ncbi:MAG: hypothetical protein QM777_12985 [Pseudorhodoferax sp.]
MRAESTQAGQQLQIDAKLLDHRAMETRAEPRERHARQDLLPTVR